MKESKFQKKVKAELDNLGYFFVKEAASIRGLPDIIGLIQGRFVALELKRSESEACKKTGRIVLQRYILSQIRKAGGYAEIAHPANIDQILEDLKNLSVQ